MYANNHIGRDDLIYKANLSKINQLKGFFLLASRFIGSLFCSSKKEKESAQRLNSVFEILRVPDLTA